MAIKKISQFTAGTPTDDDYILFEQNGDGKSAKFGDFSLTYEEIMATTDLSGKIASASSVKDISEVKIFTVSVGDNTITFRKVGNIVGVYGYLTGLSSTEYKINVNIPSDIFPKYRDVVLPIYKSSTPYEPIGSFWLTNTLGQIYKQTAATAIYIGGCYVLG